MLSIVVCSRNRTLPEAFVDNISGTVGVDFEIISIDNSENRHSIFSAYNEGVDKSQYPYLCFVHEDVIFYTNDWGKRLIEHLQDESTGIIGLAGVDLVTRVPAVWSLLPNPCLHIIQSDKRAKKPTENIHKPVGYSESRHAAVTLDGVFLCMKKELMREIRFDESLTGFHGYDYDITLQSAVAGYKNYVVYDILIEHLSRGKTDYQYYRNLFSIFRKFEKQLPLIGSSVVGTDALRIDETEKWLLKKLIKKMVRKGFGVREIKKEIHYYAQMTGMLEATKNLRFRIYLLQLLTSPRYLFRK